MCDSGSGVCAAGNSVAEVGPVRVESIRPVRGYYRWVRGHFREVLVWNVK